MRLLLVDDDTFICHLLQSYLRDRIPDLDVVVVNLGQDALDTLESDTIDLVLLDVQLPDMSGYQVLTVIRQKYSSLELPVMMETSLSESNEVIKGFNLGANEFITKPIDLPVAVARIQNLLGTRRAYLDSASQAVEPAREQDSQLKKTIRITNFDDTLASIPSEVPNERRTGPRDQRELDRTRVALEFPLTVIIEGQEYPAITRGMSDNQLTLHCQQEPAKAERYRLKIDVPDQTTVVLSVRESSRAQIGLVDVETWELIVEVLDETQWLEIFWSHLSQSSPSALQEAAVPRSPAKKTLKVEYRYQFERKLGSGGFATVFLVSDQTLKRKVAMKILEPSYAAVRHARKNFIQEARTVAQFDHPNIILVHEVDELHPNDYANHLDFPDEVLNAYPGGMIYFTMQYIDGKNLSEYLEERERLPEEEAVARLADMARALAYAHKKGVIHRDFKPQNILVQNNGRFIVTDFGIAKTEVGLEDPDNATVRTHTSFEQMICTPAYASPEQLSGEAIDFRSDIYSFGLVAYELLSGRQAYEGRSLVHLLKKKLLEPPAKLTEVIPGIDPRLETLVSRCTASEPDDRYDDIQQVLRALKPRSRDGDSLDTGRFDARMLMSLLQQVIVSESERESAILLRKLSALVMLHQDEPNSGPLVQLYQHISKPDVLDKLIDGNLNENNRDVLYQFLGLFESRISIFVLLNRFQREIQPWRKEFLAKLAVVSAGRNLSQLALFGLELPDENAVLMLRGLREVNPSDHVAVFLEWAKHKGLKTQLELLEQIKPWIFETEAYRDLLSAWSRGEGTNHRKVRELAGAYSEI